MDVGCIGNFIEFRIGNRCSTAWRAVRLLWIISWGAHRRGRRFEICVFLLESRILNRKRRYDLPSIPASYQSQCSVFDLVNFENDDGTLQNSPLVSLPPTVISPPLSTLAHANSSLCRRNHLRPHRSD